MKKRKWFAYLRYTSIPQHKFRPVKWLAFIATLLFLAQFVLETLLLSE